VLAGLPQPLAVLEVGAAAGLCLLPDRYGYDYGHRQNAPTVPGHESAPVFGCRASAGTLDRLAPLVMTVEQRLTDKRASRHCPVTCGPVPLAGSESG
jgi:hypothetical protein